jgi:hypothetical protein
VGRVSLRGRSFLRALPSRGFPGKGTPSRRRKDEKGLGRRHWGEQIGQGSPGRRAKTGVENSVEGLWQKGRAVAEGPDCGGRVVVDGAVMDGALVEDTWLRVSRRAAAEGCQRRHHKQAI